MPKAYIVITEDVHDPEKFAEYGKLAGKAMAGATLLAFDPSPQPLEGDWHGPQTVILEFESPDAARAWFESDQYQEAAKIRQSAAHCTGALVTGLG